MSETEEVLGMEMARFETRVAALVAWQANAETVAAATAQTTLTLETAERLRRETASINMHK